MRLNKVNLCWVFSEGQKGHEIQSMALAQRIANQYILHPFNLRQPWLSFAPRLIPGFHMGFDWLKGTEPKFKLPPDIIITAGRKSAAVGKFVTQRFRFKGIDVKHIQILNPSDAPENYDLLLLPKHDLKSGPNIINFCGNIHPFDAHWFVNQSTTHRPDSMPCAVIIGNPPKNYFKQALAEEFEHIRNIYSDQPLVICGSPRLSLANIKRIKQQLHADDDYWFGDSDGVNPYQSILKSARHIFVTTDSINMMNECAASNAHVTLLAKSTNKSPKHVRFTESLAERWSTFKDINRHPVKPPYALDQILQNKRFQKFLKSPDSSSSG